MIVVRGMRIGALSVFLGTALWAQTSVFEAATVKPNRSGDLPKAGPGMRNGTFSAPLVSLKALIAIAYDIPELRISGPDWLGSEKYDVEAKAPEGVPDSEMQPMLQALLRDRFQLKTRFEMKELPVYTMSVAKGGAKLRPFDPADRPAPPDRRQTSAMVGVGTTSQIADMLARIVARPVVDKTGIDQQVRYRLAVSYTPLSANGNPANPDALDIFTAIEEQLGLKLEAAREVVRVLVVEGVDRVPTEN